MVSQIILFSQPRSGSHLLERMLTKQSDVDVLAHPFSTSRGKQVPWLLRDDYANGMAEAERLEYESQIEREVETWQKGLDAAQEANHTLFIHSHPFFPVSADKMLSYMALASSPSASQNTLALPSENFTLVPNTLLLHPSTMPVITIRDPRLTVPSTYRVLERMNLPRGGSRAMLLAATCNIWNSVLYNFYTAHGIEPVVVDADDYMTSQAFVRALCARIGLDPAKALFEWEAVTQEEKEKEIHPMLYASQGRLFESKGVRGDLAARNVDLGEERLQREWEGEFGEDVGLVREMVGLAEPFYRNLYERRWKGGEE